jgi:uncharacterized membrane protein required for colicin V production
MYDPAITQAILAGVFGIISVTALTTYLKGLIIKDTMTSFVKKLLGYVISAVVSVVMTSAYLLLIAHTFTLGTMALYAFAVWLTASGLYDTYHPKPPVTS